MKGVAEVLILIDYEDREFCEESPPDPFVLSQQPNCQQGHVVEIDQSPCAQLLLIPFDQA